jgi:hypothetical protein
VWPSSVSSNIHVALELTPATDPVAGVVKLPVGDAVADAVLSVHILRRLSEPAVMNLWTAGGVADAVDPLLEGRKEGVISVPGRTEGDQEIELQSVASSGFGRQLCKRSMAGSLLLKVRTETRPSLDAQANIAPSSCGAHATELTGRELPSIRVVVLRSSVYVPLALCKLCSLMVVHFPAAPPAPAGVLSFQIKT